MTGIEWTAITPSEKRKARRLEAQGKARITEVSANYIGKRGLVVTRSLIVTQIAKAEGKS
jgi:hypothetical protein